MSAVQDWAVAMCTVGLGCTLVSMLCPKGTVRRVFGILTAVFFLCCLLTPLRTIADLFSEWGVSSEQTQVSQTLREEVDAQAQEVICEALYQDAVGRVGEIATVKKVTVFRDNARNDGIYIERVRITLDKQDRDAAPTVRKTLERSWGTPVEVYYVG